MENKNNHWLVQIFGNPCATEYPAMWEISVIRSSNVHGRRSWGWFNEDKLLISHNGGPCEWPLAPGLGQHMIDLAYDYADKLNAEEDNGERVR